MSTLKVEVVRIDDVIPHPNADRLEIAVVKGWNCVVPKGEFAAGDAAVYFPIDSLLPTRLEASLFPPESKIKLHNHRIRTIKLRGAISQGLLVSCRELQDISDFPPIDFQVGDDLTDVLGVVKYEPPESKSPQHGCQQTSKKQTNPSFKKYSDIENWKNYPKLFEPGEQVWILEKIHGTNFRAGYVPTHVNSWWKRLKNWLGVLPEYEFVYGSHNVQLQDRLSDHTWYSAYKGIRNVYLEAVDNYNLRRLLKPGEVVYGEVYGDDIQGENYLYDCKPGARKLVVFDVQFNGQYIDHASVMHLCAMRGLPYAPVDACGGFDPHDYVNAPSKLGAKIREGVVVKPITEQQCWIGRKILKLKNDEFLLTQEDDTH